MGLRFGCQSGSVWGRARQQRQASSNALLALNIEHQTMTSRKLDACSEGQQRAGLRYQASDQVSRLVHKVCLTLLNVRAPASCADMTGMIMVSTDQAAERACFSCTAVSGQCMTLERQPGRRTIGVMVQPRIMPCGDAVRAHVRREAQQRVELDVPVARCRVHAHLALADCSALPSAYWHPGTALARCSGRATQERCVAGIAGRGEHRLPSGDASICR